MGAEVVAQQPKALGQLKGSHYQEPCREVMPQRGHGQLVRPEIMQTQKGGEISIYLMIFHFIGVQGLLSSSPLTPCFTKANVSKFLCLARKCYLGHLHFLRQL